MKARVLLILCTLLMSLGIQAQNAEFETAAEAVKNMKVGWNLWNTLDSHNNNVYDQANFQSNETGWGNPKTKPELMKMMRKAGFGVIRVPVTWFPYTDVNGNVDPRWMARVHEVVDYVIDQGMYCLLNVHHDTADYGGSWIKADETNYLHNHKRFENIWRQIAEEFKDYDEHLLFEGYNEINGVNQYGNPQKRKPVYLMKLSINMPKVLSIPFVARGGITSLGIWLLTLMRQIYQISPLKT